MTHPSRFLASAPVLRVLVSTMLLAGCNAILGDRPTISDATAAADSIAADSVRADSTRRAEQVATATPKRRRGTGPRSPRTTASRPTTPAVTAARPDTQRPDTAAFAPPARPAPPAVSAPRADLQRLVAAQEQHIANVGRYASRIPALALRYLPASGVNLAILSASEAGWSGRATRTGYAGSCVVWVGQPESKPKTDGQGLVPPTAGVPVCD